MNLRELMDATNKKALAACIFLSFLGIAAIYALDIHDVPEAMKISAITKNMVGENIIACGIVKSKSVSPSETTFLALDGGNSRIRVVFFKNERSETENILRNSNVCIRGTVQIYNGSAEIIGKRLFKNALPSA